MNSKTRKINKIQVSEKFFAELKVSTQQKLAEEGLQLLKQSLDKLISHCGELIKEEWVYIKNKECYYNSQIHALLPDLNTFKLGFCSAYNKFDPKTFNKSFAGVTGRLPTFEQLEKVFFNDQKKLKKIFANFSITAFSTNEKCYVWDNSSLRYFAFIWAQYELRNSYHIPVYNLVGEATAIGFFNNLLKYNLWPDKFSEAEMQILNDVRVRYLANEIGVCGNEIKFDDKALKKRIKQSFDSQIIENFSKTSINDEKIIENLLNCDKLRCDLEPYEKKLLSDPNRGHWDLWVTKKQNNEEGIWLDLKQPLIAANPLGSICEDGLVGIDFGTKSTVVVYQEQDENTIPMRIGTGKLQKKVASTDYENPTVMELVNISQFLKSYEARLGRPETLWSDLTTSHTAEENLKDAKSDDFYAHLTELKQWAGDSNRKIRLKDKKGKDIILPEFLQLKEGEFNPIEIYAYLIGLYINNMHNGIYLDYLLSFPVTYKREVREQIVTSFTRGLKKSLPVAVLEDEEAMEKFRVQVGASEPAAYAIAALQEYGFEPEENENIYYGIFDFGGGTTDFDFGVWRCSDKTESRRYDYVIECFGAGGDQFLGGENLLELLAFEVFKDNQDILLEKGISFILPPECKRFGGSELLLNNSQEAKLNTKIMMEALRPFWEKNEGYEAKEFLTINLTNKNGDSQAGMKLKFDEAKITEILKARIDKGVENFFESLRLAFNKKRGSSTNYFINIFLAGNSSKSEIVKELFNTKIQSISKEILFPETDKELFAIFPPLGTEEAAIIQKKRNVEILDDCLEKPTGKTGVAYGLVRGRPGSRIKIVQNNILVDNESKFKYYIGYEVRGKLKVLTDRELEYDKWQALIEADQRDFNIYYTSLPAATTNSMSIKDVSRKKRSLKKVHSEGFIYYRAVDPNTIEYMVAKNQEEASKEIYLEDIIRIELD